MPSMNGIVESIDNMVVRHSERIRELDEDVIAVRKTLAEQDKAIERIEKLLYRLLVQKRIVIALVVIVAGALGGAVAWGNWLMHAELQNMLVEMKVVEMRSIK